MLCVQLAGIGSPPLARGTVRNLLLTLCLMGITPACAGNRFAEAQRRPAHGDHPRLRGEQGVLHRAPLLGLGSPPLARGTVMYRLPKSPAVRITPACAGNRLSQSNVHASPQDHPRLRGEQIAVLEEALNMLGSPPLARGTDTISDPDDNGSGITPACAGNRGKAHPQGVKARDHPRLRGEQ